MQVRMIEMSVLVDGNKVREFGHQGRTYIEGRKGCTYSLKLKNNSAQRVLVIPSVDGLGVIDGEPATDASRGYIIPAYSAIQVDGWRSSLQDVAKFVLTDKQNAYSTTPQGTPVNCGVIGAKVFAEKVKITITYTPPVEHHHHYHDRIIKEPCHPWHPWYPSPIWCSTSVTEGMMADNSSTKPAITSANYMQALGEVKCSNVNDCIPDFDVGTGWGEIKSQPVTETTFDRGEELGLLEIFYASIESLEKIGISLSKALAVTTSTLPQSFGGFCKPPKMVTK